MKFIDESKLDFQYVTNPFPHIIIDNFLKEENISNLLKEIDDLTIDKSYYCGKVNYCIYCSLFYIFLFDYSTLYCTF